MAIDEDDLKEMLDGNDNDDNEGKSNSVNCPLNGKPLPIVVLEILDSKSEMISRTLVSATEFYKTLDSNCSSEKKEILKQMSLLLSETSNLINQYDYLIAMIEDNE